MLKSYDKVLDNAAWIKQATIYKETTVTTKAKIFYFHGGGLLYGFRKDLPEKHISVITQAGYEIISFFVYTKSTNQQLFRNLYVNIMSL